MCGLLPVGQICPGVHTQSRVWHCSVSVLVTLDVVDSEEMFLCFKQCHTYNESCTVSSLKVNTLGIPPIISVRFALFLPILPFSQSLLKAFSYS